MSRAALSIALVAGLLSSPAWALPQTSTCRARGRDPVPVLWAPACALSQDPWQDCDEDPWQLPWRDRRADDRFSDPWQDGVDPWQPVFAAPPSVAAATDGYEDPWQPAFADPWQDGAEDPWQLP